MYAEDAKIGMGINSPGDCVKLQICLDKLIPWSNTWVITFSGSKSKHMSILRASNKVNFEYRKNGNNLERVSEFIELGLCITEDLPWDRDICKCIKETNVSLGLVRRT